MKMQKMRRPLHIKFTFAKDDNKFKLLTQLGFISSCIPIPGVTANFGSVTTELSKGVLHDCILWESFL